VTQKFSEAEESSDPIPDSWLNEVWSEKRNVVQLSEPQVAVGENASEVLDFAVLRSHCGPRSPDSNVEHNLMPGICWQPYERRGVNPLAAGSSRHS
jgi:hypothetical protein